MKGIDTKKKMKKDIPLLLPMVTKMLELTAHDNSIVQFMYSQSVYKYLRDMSN